MEFLINYQHILRPSLFIVLFALFAYAEFYSPLSRRRTSRPQQWSTNLGLAVINSLFIKLIIPLLAVGVALYTHEHQLGLFNYIDANYVSLPYALVFLISLLILDLIIYCQHVLFHNVPLLWRLHRVHHTEIGLDVSSALRFHPVEILLSMLIKMSFVFLLGVPVAAVIVFEMLLNALALFNHSNLKLPKEVDKQLRKVIVTPEVHWIHHSPIVKETNSNYGFNLIIWDKLFSTYISTPRTEYQNMSQGLYQFGLQKSLSFKELLILPFKKR
ncbi:sterol desaturase [Psychromonas marina]|uniref:Sterol desaturase n=1 Tax=Psychromonas marina TaxID=88364 RepID=A0ABQ6E5E3_9GAMM|nr:sterol desaturase family protein [Psychromonas marina]GLS92405.1 sterol desaturase [Psychromonas marina]